MTTKRAVSDEPIYLTDDFLRTLFIQISSRHYEYSAIPELKLRDVALCSTLVLSGIRASETGLKRKQFTELNDRILLLNVKTLKRGNMRPRIIFPKRGILKDFTFSVKQWLEKVPDKNDFVFPSASSFGISWNKSLSRYRIERIVKLKTGKFPHWLRGVHETFYGERIFHGNAWKLAAHMGLKRLDSTRPYVQTSFSEDVEEGFFN